MCYKILNLIVMLTLVFSASAQFHTITKEKEIPYYTGGNKSQESEIKRNTDILTDSVPTDSLIIDHKNFGEPVNENISKCYTYTSPESRYEYARARKRKPRSRVEKINLEGNKIDKMVATANLPELTIPNLYAEIKKNNIKYPKIVLAQAILETGWFKSSVCRNKNNLFGLTNPRTKTYYEFDHWTESVAAYKSKVQYKYKGGNYLFWLRDIGYAEDKGYIQAVIRVLKQL